MQLKKETFTLDKLKILVSESWPTILLLLCIVGLFMGAVIYAARRHRQVKRISASAKEHGINVGMTML